MSSIWLDSEVNTIKKFDNKLDKDVECDVCVVGAGITGISLGYMLAKNGYNVCILDKSSICSRTSGYTTAKITSQHDLFYGYLLNSIGTSLTKQYLYANEEAISNIENIINEENIECDFERVSNYVYTTNPSDISKFEDEFEALKILGFKANFLTDLPLPFAIEAAIEFPNQAQFHPVKYVCGLADCVKKYGGNIYTDTAVLDVRRDAENDCYLTFTNDYTVRSKYVVLACRYPFINTPGFYFLKLYQSISYAIVVETSKELFDGMYISNSSPALSLKPIWHNGKKLLLVGGNEHKVGEKIDLSSRYTFLEEQVRKWYPDAKILYRWKTQDSISLDKIPYIGLFSSMMPNFYVATGFKKWGMTSSNVAANIIFDEICGKKNNYKEIFSSTRLHPIKNHKEMTNMVVESANSLVFNKFKIPDESLNDISCDTAKIIEINGSKVGVYKDVNGDVFAVSPICTHLGCLLSWNNLDKTWDCPCHGSRFDFTGKQIYGPAIKDLRH